MGMVAIGVADGTVGILNAGGRVDEPMVSSSPKFPSLPSRDMKHEAGASVGVVQVRVVGVFQELVDQVGFVEDVWYLSVDGGIVVVKTVRIGFPCFQ